MVSLNEKGEEMAQKTKQTGTLAPKYRYALKSQIIGAGFRNLTDFSKALETDLPRISRIVSGWEIPGPHLQRDMAQTLGITLSELKELLKR